MDKSGCGGKTRQRGEKKGKWKWGDGVEIKAKRQGEVENIENMQEGACREGLKGKTEK